MDEGDNGRKKSWNSTTFFSCVTEWPREIRDDIYKLYAYLRVVDEMVEGIED